MARTRITEDELLDADVALQSELNTVSTAVAGKADTSSVVLLAGDQTISGVKTFTSAPTLAGPAPTELNQFATVEYVLSSTPGGGGVDNYAATISTWETLGGLFYKDITHDLNSYDLDVSAYTPADGKTVGLDEIERTSLNTIRVWSATDTEAVRLLVIKSAAQSFSINIMTWSEDVDGFYRDVAHFFNSLDISISAYSLVSLKTVQMGEYERLDVDTVRIRSATDNEAIRVNVIKA